MLLKISGSKFCAWFVGDPDKSIIRIWPDIPKRLRVGSKGVGSLLTRTPFQDDDIIVYIGKKILVSPNTSSTRQIRLILAAGSVGYLEGYDVKYFEPV
jgi:hypothetical protein